LTPTLPAAARLATATLRGWFWRWHGARRARAFDDLHRRMVEHARLRAVLAHPAAEPVPLRAGRVTACELSEEHAFGIYPLETVAAGAFRWSAPVSLLPLDLAARRYRVTLEKRDLRADLGPGALAAALNGRALPRGAISVSAGAVSLDLVVGWGRPQRLLLLAPPLALPRGGDRRALGLPLFAIALEPASADAAANAATAS
jgi:hypothetical protein